LPKADGPSRLLG